MLQALRGKGNALKQVLIIELRFVIIGAGFVQWGNIYRQYFCLGHVALKESVLYPKGFSQSASVAIDQLKDLASNFSKSIKNKSLIPFQCVNKGNTARASRTKSVIDLAKTKLTLHGFFHGLYG